MQNDSERIQRLVFCLWCYDKEGSRKSIAHVQIVKSPSPDWILTSFKCCIKHDGILLLNTEYYLGEARIYGGLKSCSKKEKIKYSPS